MKTYFYLKGISLNQVNRALTSDDYLPSDPDIVEVGYEIYQKKDHVVISIDEKFTFCEMLFLFIDLNIASLGHKNTILAFVDTDKKNRITEYLNDERVCLYLSQNLRQSQDLDENLNLNLINIVSASNKNYLIDIDNFFSYEAEDDTIFQEPILNLASFTSVQSGKYLYQNDDYEQDYLDDLKQS